MTLKRRNKTQKILKMKKLKKFLMLRTIERILNNVHEVLDLNLNDLIYIIRELSDEEKDKAVSIIISSQLEKQKNNDHGTIL